jgi:DNA mismatch endonuclease Vsr
MDWLTPEQRSRNMAAIRSRGNKSTEKALRFRLVRAGVSGWTLHGGKLPGKPDFVFASQRLAVFVDGCYWHGCPRCYRPPESNASYWSEKFRRNKVRDRKVSTALKRNGWTVLRLWEHQVESSPEKVIGKIMRLLGP